MACVEGRKAEDADWYAQATEQDVEESVLFTDQAYAFPASGAPAIADLPTPPEYTTWFGEGDAPPSGCSDWEMDETSTLPVELEAMVTVHPRIYIKINGCVPEGNFSIDSDEKYYGSFFVEDATGGVFVLGDSKVAHFDMGDRVRMRVRAMKNNFGLRMVAVHDIVEVMRGPEAIHYTETTEPFGDEHIGRVMRVTGVVTTEPDTFGQFAIESADGVEFLVGLDVELNRRGVRFPVGSTIQVTAPILYSFSDYTMVVMKVGQVSVLDG